MWTVLILAIIALLIRLYLVGKKSINLSSIGEISINDKVWKIVDIVGVILFCYFLIPSLFPEDWSWFKDQDYFWPASIAIVISFIMLQFQDGESEKETKNDHEHKNTGEH